MSDLIELSQVSKIYNGGAGQTALGAVDPNGDAVPSLIAELVRHHVAVTSTLTVFETFTPGRPIAPPEALELLVPQLRESYVARWSQIAAQKENAWSRILPKEMAWEKRFVDKGFVPVPIIDESCLPVDDGEVTSQTPAAGSKLDAGGDVTIVVCDALGPTTTTTT